MLGDGGRLAMAAAALCALSVSLGCQQTPPFQTVGIVGEEVTLVPVVNGNLTEIVWKRGEDMVAEWDQRLWFTSSLRDRAQLDTRSGRLTFVKPQQNDSGEYRAEALLEDEYQCTFFLLHILDHPKPPQLNCTPVRGLIKVNCMLDAQDVAQNVTPTYQWKYQKSNKEIPANTSEILLEKDVDLSEVVTCTINIYNAKADSSISLHGCSPTGADPQKRDRTWLLAPFVIPLLIAAGIICGWKRDVCMPLLPSADVTEGAGASPEKEHLRKECSRHLEENDQEKASELVS